MPQRLTPAEIDEIRRLTAELRQLEERELEIWAALETLEAKCSHAGLPASVAHDPADPYDRCPDCGIRRDMIGVPR